MCGRNVSLQRQPESPCRTPAAAQQSTFVCTMEYDNIYQVLPHGPGVRVVFRLKVSENKIGLHDSIIFRPELPYASAFELPVGTFFEADEFCNEGAEEDCIHMDSNSYDPPLITTHTDTTDIASEEVIVQVKYLKVKRYQTGKKDYKQCYRRPQDWVELGDDRLCWIPTMYPYSAGGKPPGQQPVVCQIKPEIKAIVIPPKQFQYRPAHHLQNQCTRNLSWR